MRWVTHAELWQNKAGPGFLERARRCMLVCTESLVDSGQWQTIVDITAPIPSVIFSRREEWPRPTQQLRLPIPFFQGTGKEKAYLLVCA